MKQGPATNVPISGVVNGQVQVFVDLRPQQSFETIVKFVERSRQRRTCDCGLNKAEGRCNASLV